MCLRRGALTSIVVAALLAAAPACILRGSAGLERGRTTEHLAKAGLQLRLPYGWYGRIVRANRGFPNPAVEAANFPLPPLGTSVVVPSPTGLKRSQVRLVLLEVGNPPGRRFPPARRIRPLSHADFAFRLPGVPASHAFARRHFSQGGRSFSLMVEFGARPAPERLQRAVEELLRSLWIRPAPGSNPAYWRPLRRPLTLPTLTAPQRCRTSPASNSAPRVATALGRGPAYAVLGSAQGADLGGEITRGGWHYHKTLWAFAPRYLGPLLIRGRRLDAPGGVRFHLGGPPLVELRVPPAGTGRHWRYLPSDTLFRTAGCYGFQIDGRGFSEKIVFPVSFAPYSTPRVGRAPTPRLWPLPERTRRQCARLQAHVHFVVLCPQQVPRPTRGWTRGDRPPPFYSDIFGSPQHPELPTPYGIEVGYSAAVEPQSGRNSRRLVWHNRPCCFLHFTVFVPHGPLPSGLVRARIGGKRGEALYARGYGLRGSQRFYWANHTWFFWRERGVVYAASLHYFGDGTTDLLARLIGQLKPANTLR
jgi:hypothetical protein